MKRKRSFPVPSQEILSVAEEIDADLIFSGATVRRVGGRPFLGHIVANVLEHAETTLVVVPLARRRPSWRRRILACWCHNRSP